MRENSDSRSSIRYRAILTGATSSILARALAVLLSLLAVRVALPSLGNEQFALWASIASLQLWLQLADLGLPAGMNNPLAVLLAKRESIETRRMVFSAAVVILCAAFLIFCLFAVLLWLYKTPPLGQQVVVGSAIQASSVVVSGVGLILIGLPHLIVAKVWALQQKAYVVNLWQCAGQALAIAALYVCAHWHLDLFWFVTLTTGAVSLANLACLVHFYYVQVELRPTWVDFEPKTLGPCWSTSAAYTCLQLAGMLLMNSAVFVIAATLTPLVVAVYAATSRFTNLCSFATQMSASAFWASYTDAVVRSDRQWLRGAFIKHQMASVGSTLAAGVALIFAGPTLISWWTRGSIEADRPLLYWLLVWQVIVAVMSPIGALLNAHERYRLQTATSLAAGVAGVALAYWLAPQYGAASVVAATCIMYVMFVVVPTVLQTRALLGAES